MVMTKIRYMNRCYGTVLQLIEYFLFSVRSWVEVSNNGIPNKKDHKIVEQGTFPVLLCQIANHRSNSLDESSSAVHHRDRMVCCCNVFSSAGRWLRVRESWCGLRNTEPSTKVILSLP